MDDYSFVSDDDSDVDNENYVEPEILPLEAARRAFNWLVRGPHPVSVDGRQFPGLPARDVPLDELLTLLLAQDWSPELHDAVWVHLVQRSRAEGSTWTVACVGLAMPALALTARRLCRRWADDPRDVNASVLEGFLDGLAHIDLARPQVLVRLRWIAYRAGYVFVRDALDLPLPTGEDFRSQEPTRPWGHPDLVLARAVADGVITVDEANLIGATRLEEDYSLEAAARERLLRYDHVQVLRRRAEYRLAAYLDADAAYDSPQEQRDREVVARVLATDAITSATHATTGTVRRAARRPAVNAPDRTARTTARTSARTTAWIGAKATADGAVTRGMRGQPDPTSSPSVTATGADDSGKTSDRLLETGPESGVIQCGGSPLPHPRTTAPASPSATATASSPEVSR
jgi:hypothetical protein